ncbi:hypothetical protein [Paenibacillus sp. KN14-4R]|uniref:hypothetical protein n=1 Tax=Paenibacillus sp. KN14-4R TaxID=3445773 RepID=UPI003FA18731
MQRRFSWFSLVIGVFIVIGILSMTMLLAIPILLIGIVLFLMYRFPRVSWWLKSKFNTKKNPYYQAKRTTQKRRKSHLRVVEMKKDDDSNESRPKYH